MRGGCRGGRRGGRVHMKIMHWTLSLSAPPLGKTPDIHKITSTYLAVFSEGVSCLVSHTLLSAWIAWCLVFVSGELVHVVSTGVGL